MGPSFIVLDSSTVFWVNDGLSEGQSQIMKVAKSGGEPAQIAFNQPALHGLGITPTSVWSAVQHTLATYSTISTYGKGGNTMWPLESYKQNSANFLGITMQGTVIAWSSNEGQGTIFRGDTQGGARVPVATMQGQVVSLALDGGTTYWVSPSLLAIMRADTGAPEVFAGDQMSPTDLVVDTDDIYWTCNDGTVKRLAKSSPSGQPVVITSDAISPRGIAVDTSYVYWAEAASGGRVRAAPKGGGPIVTLATGEYPFDVAVDADTVYATMQGDGSIVAIRKK
ncbi:Putative serine/threonine-protein kinase pknH [Minicystis rosea]|nr:Putative serine/threonine-protein kinase pknH [Minicystis rosea]